jgi:hypothetical protein
LGLTGGPQNAHASSPIETATTGSPHDSPLALQHAARRLRDVESVLLERYRAALQGSVLEMIPGGSRLTEELVHQSRAYVGIGPSPAVINVCRQMYVAGRFVISDVGDLDQFEPGRFDVVFAGRCAIDSLGAERRRALFEAVHRTIGPGGLWIFSSHNAASVELQQIAEQSSGRRRGGLLRGLRVRSSRAPMDDYELGSELLSGIDGDLSVGPFRITRAAQTEQLEQLGFELAECLDLGGHQVPSDPAAAESPELHYVARPAPAGDGPVAM